MPNRSRWLTAARAVLGFGAALALWLGLTTAYNGALSATAEPLLRAFERPPVTRLRAEEKEIIVDREDFPRSSARPGIPGADLTFNFIIMATLFAASPQALSNRGVGGFLAASACLFLTHVLALAAVVQSIYALQLGAWSAAHYGAVARNLWGAAAHFYRVVGLYAFAFGLWWLFRPTTVARSAPSGKRRKSRR